MPQATFVSRVLGLAVASSSEASSEGEIIRDIGSNVGVRPKKTKSLPVMGSARFFAIEHVFILCMIISTCEVEHLPKRQPCR